MLNKKIVGSVPFVNVHIPTAIPCVFAAGPRVHVKIKKILH